MQGSRDLLTQWVIQEREGRGEVTQCYSDKASQAGSAQVCFFGQSWAHRLWKADAKEMTGFKRSREPAEFPLLTETTEGFSQGFGVTLVETFPSNVRYDYKILSSQNMLKLKILHAGFEGCMLSGGGDLLKFLSVQGSIWSHSSDSRRWTPRTAWIDAGYWRDNESGNTFAHFLADDVAHSWDFKQWVSSWARHEVFLLVLADGMWVRSELQAAQPHQPGARREFTVSAESQS